MIQHCRCRCKLIRGEGYGFDKCCDGTGSQVDFTKFDPISNQVFGDAGTTSISADLATVTQGVATCCQLNCFRL